MDEIIEAATRLCHGEYGSLHLLEGNELPAVSHSGSSHHWDYDQEHAHVLDRKTMVGRAAVTREVVHIPDIEADAEYAYSGPRTFRVGLGVPILFEDDLIGAMGIIRRSPEPFADEQIELVKTFADQAAIAITNARLVDALQHQLEQQRAIGDVLRAIARSEGLQTVLDEIVETVSILGRGDNVRMWLVRDGFLHAVANGGWTDGWDYDRAHPHMIDASSASGRAALTREPVHIPDVTADPEYTYDGPVAFRTNLSVPILLDDEVIGVFGIVRAEPEPFSDDIVALVQTFADQAAITIANGRLIEAIERQLEQQQAFGDVLRAIALSEPLEEVFRAVVTAARTLCGGEHAQLYLAEGEVFRINAHTLYHDEVFDYEREHPHSRDRTSVVGRVALSGAVEQIPDVLDDPEYSYGSQELVGYRAVLGVPIVLEGELTGVISVDRQEVGGFADEDVAVVTGFAEQAAIAIANARLLDALERQLDQQRAVGAVLGVVARADGLDAVFDAAVTAAARLCSAEYGQLCIADGDVFRLAGNYGASREIVEYERAHPMPRDRTSVVGRVAVTGDVVHIPDTLEDPEYTWAGQPSGGYRAMLGVPIFVEGELIGVINVVRNEPVPFTEEHIGLVKTFADQAAIAIANARLLDAVERQRSELARFVSPQVAELVSSDEGEGMLAGHRAYVTSMFCDLRGFTSFTELAEPEELFEVLREYHLALGELIPRYEGTLEHFAGDGLMVFFNDPVPVEEHELKAVRLAVAARERFEELASVWGKRGHELGLGIGIAAGYATLGRIGFEGRYDYGVLGTVTNLASRLSSAAEPGQTLISQRVFAAVEERVDAVEVGQLELKGFGRPVPAYEVRGLNE